MYPETIKALYPGPANFLSTINDRKTESDPFDDVLSTHNPKAYLVNTYSYFVMLMLHLF